MNQHFQLNDDTFEHHFAEGILNPKMFSHEAHVRLAWIHIRKYGVEKAILNICGQIRNFAVINGAAGKYNKTITVAAVRAVYHFMLKSPSNDFHSFISQNSCLNTHFMDLLDQHYSDGLLFTEEAKKAYLEPDLLPFDPLR